MNCLTLLDGARRLHSSNPALVLLDGAKEINSLSYVQFFRHIEVLSAAFLKLNIKSGDPVLIISGLCPQSLISIFSCFAIGAMVVPLNTAVGEKELGRIIKEIKPVGAICDGSLDKDTLTVLKNSCGILITICPEASAGRYFKDVRAYEDVLGYEDGPDAASFESLMQRINGSEPALLIQTSGSSGVPKNILYSHQQLVTFMNHHDYLYRQFSDVAGESVFKSDLIATLPLSHLGGLGFCIQGLMMGRTVNLLRNFLPQHYLEHAVRKKVRLMMMVPSMYEQLLSTDIRDKDLAALKFCISIGEDCCKKLLKNIQDRFGVAVYSAYGLTECETGIGHGADVIEAKKIPEGSCGRLLFGEVKLVDKQGHRNNKQGELWIKNKTVFPCYTDSELNLQCFHKGWFRTGDLFYRDAEGNYYHRGRQDNMFVVHGENIYPAEIENIFNAHQAIKQSVVSPIKNLEKRVFPAVLVKTVSSGRNIKPGKGELIDYYLAHGSQHAAPGWIFFADVIPTIASGKVDRIKCASLLQQSYEAHQQQLQQ